mmetsp:Transcript_123865/g.361697  ORF Transcript_123865/g.361697 Transcript_123865/m.361697 type:complete len:437 (+) Transcript_123865:226-1536(+)
MAALNLFAAEHILDRFMGAVQEHGRDAAFIIQGAVILGHVHRDIEQAQEGWPSASTEVRHANDCDDSCIQQRVLVLRPVWVDHQRHHNCHAAPQAGVPHHEGPTEVEDLVTSRSLDQVHKGHQGRDHDRPGNEAKEDRPEPKLDTWPVIKHETAGTDDDEHYEVSNARRTVQEAVHGDLVLNDPGSVYALHQPAEEGHDDAAHAHELPEAEAPIGAEEDVGSLQRASPAHAADLEQEGEEDSEAAPERDGAAEEGRALEALVGELEGHDLLAHVAHIEDHQRDGVVQSSLAGHHSGQQRVRFEVAENGQRGHGVRVRDESGVGEGLPPVRHRVQPGSPRPLHHGRDQARGKACADAREGEAVEELREEVEALDVVCTLEDGDRDQEVVHDARDSGPNNLVPGQAKVYAMEDAEPEKERARSCQRNRNTDVGKPLDV